MMEGGLPEPKRPRLGLPPPPADWPTSANSPRHLPLPPPLPPPPYQHTSPFSRPDGPQPHIIHDRRPPDHNPYEHHHQDPRRPNSGPTHAYYAHPAPHPPPPPPQQSYSGPRDPMVKRDPSDEPPPPPPQAIFRPPSTGNGSDHNVNSGSHHEPTGRPQYDPTRPQSFQQSSYPPTPSPMSAPEPYSPFQNNGLPGPRDQAYSVTYPAAQRTEQQNQIKRKAQRAAQACDSCRTLKAKCDEGRPACGSCKEKGAECRYRDPPPKQQDKQTADIIEVIMDMRSMMNTRFERLEDEFKAFKASMQIHAAKRQSIEPNLKEEVDDSNHQAMPPYSRPSVGSESHTFPSADSPYSSNSGQQRDQQRLTDNIQKTNSSIQQDNITEAEDEEDKDKLDSGNPGPAGVSTMPVNHTTGAAKLLLVAPIRQLTNKDSPWFRAIGGTMFPIVTETRRGCLRLYGQGEGNDNIPGYDKDPITDHTSDHSPGDSPMNAPSPDCVHEEWGQIGGFTPPPHMEYPLREFTRGDINPLGMPDFSRSTVVELINSYKSNMNNMHPLLSPKALDDAVERFLKNIPDGPGRPKQLLALTAGFIGGNPNHPESPGNKRKRSPASMEFPEVSSVPPEYKLGHPWRDMTTCIVLLCMALGKICLDKKRLSDYDTDGEKDMEGFLASSPVYRNGYPPSPMQGSSSMATPNMMGSPQEMERNRSRSRRTSVENSSMPRTSSAKVRNIDRIPGLSYFAIATDIIGNQLGGNGLQHVHANILAALYQGQLARVMESHAYIHAACRSLQVLLRVKIDRYKTYKAKSRIPRHEDNPLIFAFWTCLQLESDILAELPCPHTGILTFEEDMPHPNLEKACSEDGFDKGVIESYLAQLYLRKHLNSLHNTFYKPNSDLNPKSFLLSIAASIENLETSIKIWAPNMAWNMDAGEPAPEILGARLRAKYYGAQVITYRHFILKILQGSEPLTGREFTLPEIAADDSTVREYASRGIRALIHSTRAFHGLGPPGQKRLIVTNVWGTAHAQWGNMLVLQAAYMHPILKPLLLNHISSDGLRTLFKQTMQFLKSLASPSSALAVDWRILFESGSKSGLCPTPPDFSSSFGSSADTPMAGQ